MTISLDDVRRAIQVLQSYVDEQTPPTVFGCNVDTDGSGFFSTLARQDIAYAPKNLRLFFPGLPATLGSNPLNIAANQRSSIVSWKGDPDLVASGEYDQILNKWLAQFCRPTYVVYYHEPEDNWPTYVQKAHYLAAQRHFLVLVAAHPNRKNLIRTIIYGDYTFDKASGRDPMAWYPGDEYVDVIGADVYSFHEKTAKVESMAAHQVRRPSLAFAQAHGKPYIIPELGYDGPNRAAWLADAVKWAKDNRVAVVDYFDSIGTLGDHRLTDVASQQAWKAGNLA